MNKDMVTEYVTLFSVSFWLHPDGTPNFIFLCFSQTNCWFLSPLILIFKHLLFYILCLKGQPPSGSHVYFSCINAK